MKTAEQLQEIWEITLEKGHKNDWRREENKSVVPFQASIKD